MKENYSPLKRSQSRNFSSRVTIETSSPKSSPIKEIFSVKKKKTDPRFLNQILFDNPNYNQINQNKGINFISQSLNIKPKDSSIYLTGIGNVNDISSDLFQIGNSQILDIPNLKKSQNKKIKNKISLDTLPYIITTSNHKHNQFSPVFTCCDQELTPKLLNKFLYQQKEKESREPRYKQCKTVENS